ncbi:MAG: dTMP kinase [Myxococcales bacterium]|nr:dTMP kinase [Myxococcales bacterium]
MFVVFEGIDGGGKTTLSNMVAKRLRADGLKVAHVREGGKFASKVTQAMRELGRDARNLELGPRAELMLYLTREVQLVDEATRPATATNDVVIADRYIYTAEALAIYGRGLAPSDVEPLVHAAAGGLFPELVVLVDVDPHVARARRKVSKIVEKDDKPPSRKGLTGTGLQHRLRAGYRALAARDPDRWLVIDNTEADLEATAAHLVEVIRAGRKHDVMAAATAPTIGATDTETAREALLGWIDRRAVKEPGLAAYFLDGVPGVEFADRRRALGERAPHVVATGLRGLDDAASWDLRRALAEQAPDDVAKSIVDTAASHPAAADLLRSLVAIAPRAVGEALYGRDDELAWELRARLQGADLIRSLGGVLGARAWSTREAWLAEQGGVDRIDTVMTATILCAGITGVSDDRAWELREAMREVAPVAALEAIYGITDERAWAWRRRDLLRAPKTVMRTLDGIDDARAWELRAQVATDSEEALDSMVGLDSASAWKLREATIDVWPSTTVKSLGALGATARGRAMALAVLARHPSDVAVWHHVVSVVPH